MQKAKDITVSSSNVFSLAASRSWSTSTRPSPRASWVLFLSLLCLLSLLSHSLSFPVFLLCTALHRQNLCLQDLRAVHLSDQFFWADEDRWGGWAPVVQDQDRHSRSLDSQDAHVLRRLGCRQSVGGQRDESRGTLLPNFFTNLCIQDFWQFLSRKKPWWQHTLYKGMLSTRSSSSSFRRRSSRRMPTTGIRG